MLRVVVGSAGVLAALGVTSVALAGWSASGAGSGTAVVGTLAAPPGVTVSSVGSAVSVSWSAVVPPEGALAGYTVTRYNGSAPSPACGTDPAQVGTYVPAGTLACTDASVPDGTYAYAVTAVFRTWTAQSAPSGSVVVEAPTQTVSLAAGATGASLSGTTLFYRPGVAGSFRLVDTVTSAGAGPASAAFPGIAAAGWSHAGETVTVGSGGTPTTAYQSSPYSWTPAPALPGPHTVTGRDTRGAAVSTALTLIPDALGPTGGALTVNGTPAAAGETSSYSRAAFPIDVRTDYGTDAGSGPSTSALMVETAPLSGDSCGAYGSLTVITGSPVQSGLTTACYRYRLTGTDAVGNTSTVSTVVRYDLGPPTQTVSLVSGVNASQTGNVIYFRSAAGSFSLLSVLTDTETAPASVNFPLVSTSGWTHAAETDVTGTGSLPTLGFSSSTYSLTSTASTPGAHSVVGKDAAGNSVATGLTFSKDSTLPTGGALTVNAGVAATAGSTTFNRTGGFAIGVRTDYTDAGSGIGSSVLTVASATLSANTCGTFGPTTVVVGAPAQSGLTTGCYRYTLTGTDNVGNQATPIYTTVKVDLVLPTGGAVTVNGVAADTGGTTSSGPTNDNPFPIDSRTDWTDAVSGLASSTLTRAVATYTAGGCGTFSGSTTVTGTTAQSGLATSCYRYTLTGTDNAGNVATVATVVKNDVVAPTGGALTVNAVVASTGGSSSLNKTGSVTIGVRTDYSDAASGIDTSLLAVASATLSGGSCGTFGAATVIAGAPAQSGLVTGCYRYALTGTDLAGNVATALVTTVKVDRVPPTGGAVSVNGVAADATGTTSGPTNDNPFPIDSRTDWNDAESGMGTSVLTRTSATYSGGLCTGTYATSVTLPGTPAQSALATKCWKYTLTGTDAAGNASAVSTVVKYDITLPTAGALTVNGTVASAAGTSSSSYSASFTIGTRTANTDAASGLASTTLTRDFATLSGSTCGAYGSTVTITGTPAQAGLATGCYRYTLTGLDLAGNTVAISTTVKLGVYASAVSLVNGTGTAGRVDQGDRVVVTFSDDIAVSSLCSAWSGNTSDQLINADNAVTVTLVDGVPGNDSLTVSSSQCTLNVGNLGLASTAYTLATVTFGGAGPNASTVAWSASTRQLTVTLGAVSGPGPAVVATNVVATYTPSVAVTNPGAVPLGGSFATAAVKQF